MRLSHFPPDFGRNKPGGRLRLGVRLAHPALGERAVEQEKESAASASARPREREPVRVGMFDHDRRDLRAAVGARIAEQDVVGASCSTEQEVLRQPKSQPRVAISTMCPSGSRR